MGRCRRLQRYGLALVLALALACGCTRKIVEVRYEYIDKRTEAGGKTAEELARERDEWREWYRRAFEQLMRCVDLHEEELRRK